MTEVVFSKTTEQKYDLLDREIRRAVNSFFDKLLDNDISARDLKVAFKDNGTTIYAKKCGSIYIILLKDCDEWLILDLLTLQEFRNFFS